jgi:hypothetical protein
VFSRINNGESTAVVGEPHIGKSSLQRYIRTRFHEWLSSDVTNVIVAIDCHVLEEAYTPARFWNDVLAFAADDIGDQALRHRIDTTRQKESDSFALRRLFERISNANVRVVLLIDEFDLLLYHTRFQRSDFFGTLRVLAIHTGGLAVVTFSRLSVAEMNRRTASLIMGGSPFFNNMIEERLLPLQSDEIDLLIDQALLNTGVAFTPQDRKEIERLSGRHPFLVQIACAAMFHVQTTQVESKGNPAFIQRMIQSWAGSHFDDVWRHLTPDARKVMAILAATESGETLFDLNHLERYEADLVWLADGHLIEATSAKRCAAWRGKRWRVSAKSLAEWIVINRKWNDIEGEATIASLLVASPIDDERREQIDHLRQIMLIKRSRARDLERQLAHLGLQADPAIKMEFEELRRELVHIEQQLRQLGN